MARKQATPKVTGEGKSLGRHGRVQLLGKCDWIVPEGSRMKKGDHGTTTRYGQAIRVGATACQKCKTANTQRDLAYRRKKRAGGVLLGHEIEGLSVKELRAVAAELGVEVPSKTTKARLVEALQTHR